MPDLLTIPESEAESYSVQEPNYFTEEEDFSVETTAEEVIPSISFSIDDEWDMQMTQDATTGKMDNLAAKAIAEFLSGEASAFPPDDE